jgi:L-arabinose isomerase
MVGDKPRIGLFATVDELYSTAFDMAEIDKVVKDDIIKLINNLSGKNEVFFKKIARTEKDGIEAGKYLSELDLDLIIISEFVYTLDEVIMGFLKNIKKDIPILVLMIQGYEGIPEDLTVKNFSRSWGINGAVQLTASIPNMIKDFEYLFLVGNPGEQGIAEKIDKMAKASWVINSLKKAKLAYLPGVFKGMHDNWDNNAKLESLFGVELDWLNFSDVVREAKSVPDKDIKAEVLNIKNRYKVIEPLDVDLFDEARMYLGVKKLIKTKNLSGLTITVDPNNCNEFMDFRVLAYFTMSKLMDDGIACSDEGDMCNVIAQLILGRIAGAQVQQWENWAFDKKQNILMGGHSGVGSTALAKDPSQIYVRNLMYDTYTLPNGEVRKGFAFNFVLKPGKVTLLALGAMHDEYRFKIIRGTAIDYKLLDIHSPFAVIKLDYNSVEEYFEKICRFGCGKHFALVYDDLSDICVQVAKIKKMNYLLI